MADEFRPMLRSQIWLGDPAIAASYRAEGEAIASRLAALSSTELSIIAADTSEQARMRWEATRRLSRADQQRIADSLVQRLDDPWWATMVALCAPANTEATHKALKRQLQSQHRKYRHRALQLLSSFGDDSIDSTVEAMLESDDRQECFVAITCLAARGSPRSLSNGWHQVAGIDFPRGMPPLIDSLPVDPETVATAFVGLCASQDFPKFNAASQSCMTAMARRWTAI